MVLKKGKGKFLHGGETSPQYFCSVCGFTHTKHSIKGKLHDKFRRKF